MYSENEFAAYFLGAYAENNDVFEEAWLEFYRDHVYWRRSFHPEDSPPVEVVSQYQDGFLKKVGATKQALHQLTAKLKQSVPFYHPRYIGHMSSDLLMSGLLGQMITTLYNPNNVSVEAAPVTVDLELEYAKKLAQMLGFKTDDTLPECAFGNLTSGGTLANYQGLWYGLALKHYPFALQAALGKSPSVAIQVGQQLLSEMTHWELSNLTFDEIVNLKADADTCVQGLSKHEQANINEAVESCRLEQLGNHGFHTRFPEWKTPWVLVPATAHYSWQKAVKLMGIGTHQLVKIPTDDKMRLCPNELNRILEECLVNQQPVLTVVGVLGTTEYGTIDPIDKLVDLRDRFSAKGLTFFIHVDAAWGGFLSSMFRDEQGQSLASDQVASACQYFPSKDVYSAMTALKHTESITVDPHKLGYLPFGCGAFICRDGRAREFVTQSAAYVFDADSPDQPLQLGQYILEGSKPGAIAAGAYVAERVLPFHAQGLGKLPEQSICITEYFFAQLVKLRRELAGTVHLSVPIEPDSNLLCLTFNLNNNPDAATMNAFVQRVYQKLNIDSTQPLQTKQFFASCTRIYRHHLSDNAAGSLCDKLGLDANSFVLHPEHDRQADNLFVLRHTLMNPWLINQANNYIDAYLDYLKQEILALIHPMS
ncbi:hypothetical protein LJ739_02260 [Aestuariibacter halophilus]|uniref:L-tyrosine decarboxylase C-terminal domain-containing protein n=1 Tax=Fluctibacter halophilus TaxID=226011 RepID=A0ABS8G3B9_9ALTE|nr:pyridoxal-dependent decarboxylase [Aestuariibacter halophilus]MCC2615065.1 hypothetical protein [Aestuariibacter halophilus]